MPDATPGAPRRVLLVPVESARWQQARAWSYTTGLAFEEGLIANGAECTVLPALQEFPSLSPRSWLYHALEVLRSQRFDQAWVWLTYTFYDASFFEWLESVAPVRVGVVISSMEYTATEYDEAPYLVSRRDFVDQQLRHMTHVLAVDEFDVAGFSARLDRPAAWLPGAVPARFLRAPEQNERPAGRAAEESSALTARFDALHRTTIGAMTNGGATRDSLDRYVEALRRVRRETFDGWLDRLAAGGEGVNLPTLLKAYAPLVIESMAAGVPVVSWDVPHRPANRALFDPGRAIRLFDRDDAERLAGHLRELRSDPEQATAQAAAAHQEIRRLHTTEHRVAQILSWIDTGTAADPLMPRSPSVPASAGPTFLPPGYQRRVSRRPADDRAPAAAREEHADLPPVPPPMQVPFGRERRSRSDAYPLADRLMRELECSRVVDVGCPEPSALIRLASSVAAIAVTSAETARAYERRCPSVVWVAESTDATGDRSWPPVVTDERSLVLCIEQFERAGAPDRLAAYLLDEIANACCGLVVSVARDRRWGAGEMGPPVSAKYLQEWTASEIAALLDATGFDVVHQSPLPAARDRRELTSVATIVAARSLAPARRAQIAHIAARVLGDYLADRNRMSNDELFDTCRPIGPTIIAPSASSPGVHALLDDDTIVAVHGRSPAQEAARWLDRLGPLDGGPLVLFGLGLGHHAAAAAHGSGQRVIVVEPLAAMTDLARTVDATREALEAGRIAIVRDWAEFAALARRTGLTLATVRFDALAIYQRLAPETYTAFTTLLEAARDWDRAGLTSAAKPFFHEPGMSVIVPTFNRVESMGRLVHAIASQESCGVPVEFIAVNDAGDPAVFDVVREAGRASGLDVRCLDTHYSGYGLTLARNVGLRFARYDTAVFLDDDLRVDGDLLRRYREAPTGVRAGRIDFEFMDGRVRRQWPDRRLIMRGRDRVLHPWAAFEEFLWGGNCAVSTELALALGGFDEAFLGEGEEDTDFCGRAIRATQRPVAVPSARALHEGLDHGTRVWFGIASGARVGKSRALLADPARGVVVNGGVSYWAGPRWASFVVNEP